MVVDYVFFNASGQNVLKEIKKIYRLKESVITSNVNCNKIYKIFTL